MQVIGAGLGRTGTSSLKAALELLGFGPCHHMSELLDHPEQAPGWKAACLGESVDWEDLLGAYRSATDLPSAKFWQPLSEKYPEAKLILTVRDPDRWFTSMRDTLGPVHAALFDSGGATNLPAHAARLAPVFDMLRVLADSTFGESIDDREAMIELFERHNATVTASLPADRLLVYEVGQGWEPLCEFLDVPVPESQFPHVNDREQFQARLAGIIGTPG